MGGEGVVMARGIKRGREKGVGVLQLINGVKALIFVRE